MLRLVVLATTLLSGPALAASNQTNGGGCCTVFFILLFVYIFRSGGADWLRSIGAAAIPGIFGWFIWRDRALGTGSRWVALIFGSLQVFFFLLGVLGALLMPAMLARVNPLAAEPSKPIDLSKIPEDESLGLHPLSTITSDPPGAKVFVNGQERGKTPLETPLAAGQANEVRVELAGYFPGTQAQMPNAREHLTFAFILKASAQLKVTSEPPGARVLSGTSQLIERTPGTALNLEVGEAEIVVLLDGYQPLRQKLSLATGETLLEVALLPGVKISVATTPDKADLFVDGAWVGLTPRDVFVAPKGKHTLEVKKEPFAPVKKVFASVSKPSTFTVKLVDTGRVEARQTLARARVRYDKVNLALEKIQYKVEHTYTVPPRLERERDALERDMEKAAGALEQAEAALKAIEESRPAEPPPPETDP